MLKKIYAFISGSVIGTLGGLIGLRIQASCINRLI